MPADAPRPQTSTDSARPVPHEWGYREALTLFRSTTPVTTLDRDGRRHGATPTGTQGRYPANSDNLQRMRAMSATLCSETEGRVPIELRPDRLGPEQVDRPRSGS